MLTIESYVARRKEEDHLNEFDTNARGENLRSCVNYVFEYFNNYLSTTPAEHLTVLHNEKAERHRKKLHEFDPEIHDWLMQIYVDHGNALNLSVNTLMKEDEFFFLMSTDAE